VKRYVVQDAIATATLYAAIVASFGLAIPAGVIAALGVPDVVNPAGLAIGWMLGRASGWGRKS
jgi:hypothetical protein